MRVYFYHDIITFCYKLVIQGKIIIKLVIVQAFDFLNRHLMYYLCINEYNYVGQSLM